MARDYYSPREFSLRPQDLIPDDEDDLADSSWLDYCQEAAKVDTNDLMLVVSEAFSASEVLRRVIDKIKRAPFTPGERRHLHPSENTAIGDEVSALIDQALDDQVSMRTTMGGDVT